MATDDNEPTVEDAFAACKAAAESIGQALAPLVRAISEAVNRMHAVPGIRELMEEYERDPEAFRAPVEAGRLQRPLTGCHCLCAKAHPGDAVCNGAAVITRRITTALLGAVDVPVCAPCAASAAAVMLTG